MDTSISQIRMSAFLVNIQIQIFRKVPSLARIWTHNLHGTKPMYYQMSSPGLDLFNFIHHVLRFHSFQNFCQFDVIWWEAPVEGWARCWLCHIGRKYWNREIDALMSRLLGDEVSSSSGHSSQSALSSAITRWWSCISNSGRQPAAFHSFCCWMERVDILAIVQGTADCELLEVVIRAVVGGTVDDRLLAAFRRIFHVEKPVNILMVVQGTVSCRLIAAVPSCCGVCIFRRVLEFF